MNWTGGSLQRTKKANVGMLQQQKTYFAKARANTQNTPRTPTTPFRPSFLRDDDKLGPSPFGSYSVRCGERSMTSGGEILQCEHAATPENNWSAISGHEDTPRELSSRRVLHHLIHSETPPQAHQGLRSFKCQAPDTDVEIQLLEANKKRLLTQLDWIGMNPSKPVSQSFLACKQNERIGKRRITNGRCRLAKRQRMNGNSTREDPDLQRCTLAKPFYDCTKREKPEDIRIRIGTDALSDTDFPRVEGYANSEPCSDLMLFEQDRRLIVQSAGQGGSEPSSKSRPDVPMSANEHDDLLPQISAIGRDAQHYESVFDLTEPRDKLLKQQSQLTRIITDEPESLRFDYRLVDRVQDDECSLRLVFSDASGFSVGVRTHSLDVIDRQETFETQLLGELQSTSAYQTERVDCATNDREGRGAYAIVDPKPWMAYVAISDGCAKPFDAGLQLLELDDSTTRNKSGVPTTWSQCATQGQEDGEYFDTTLHSDALVSLRQDVGNFMTEREAEIKPDRQSKSNAAHVQTLDEEEKKWQAFVFG